MYWQNTNGEVHSDKSVNFSFGTTTAVINISNIRAIDGGTYTCIAENEMGIAYESAVVYVAPYFTIQPEDILTINGRNERITCAAEAFPPPTILWRALSRPEIKYGSGSGIFMDLFQEYEYVEDLVFDPVQFGDEGVYQCHATNEYGVALNNITLTG